ncbi:MAG TPA: Gfo/Idh/MocA family oxidoreductase [Allosphingosinicella sp.]|jgi:predicted dehydrogenase|nr:Gfo/Idh/MocA family oxidoreductase [Allosphingosinicella sp.]
MNELFSRRGLIQLGLGSAAAGMLAPAAAQTGGAPRASGDGIGFAIVGLGKLSLGQIVPGFRNCRSARLAALVSGHPDKAHRIAAEQGLPADAIYDYENFDRIARDPRIQVVYIVLPNFMHAEYTIRALKAGKHVLCEKPMATNVADCERMIAAAKAADRKLMIAYRCHYEPLNLAAMRLLRGGQLGRKRLVVTKMGRQSDLNEPSDAWRLDMAKSGGGALADMGIYGINGTRYLLNEEPVEVRAWAQTDRSDPRFRTTEDLISWQFRFPSGAIGEGSTSFDYAGTMDWEVFCERGRLVGAPGCFYSGNHLQVIGASGVPAPQIVEIDQFAREMDWMSDAVRGRAPLVSPGEEGMQDQRLIAAILESVARGGGTVRADWGYKRAYDPAAMVGVTA